MGELFPIGLIQHIDFHVGGGLLQLLAQPPHFLLHGQGRLVVGSRQGHQNSQ